MRKFKIEQLAISPRTEKGVDRAKALMRALGVDDWIEDEVTAHGCVRGADGHVNTAGLSFNYGLGADGLEFELLEYKKGKNWLASIEDSRFCAVASHIGMHVTAEELQEWRKSFEKLGIEEAQSVNTTAHTNPAIKDKRRYNYVIFDTRDLIGLDIKFIVRKDL